MLIPVAVPFRADANGRQRARPFSTLTTSSPQRPGETTRGNMEIVEWLSSTRAGAYERTTISCVRLNRIKLFLILRQQDRLANSRIFLRSASQAQACPIHITFRGKHSADLIRPCPPVIFIVFKYDGLPLFLCLWLWGLYSFL